MDLRLIALLLTVASCEEEEARLGRVAAAEEATPARAQTPRVVPREAAPSKSVPPKREREPIEGEDGCRADPAACVRKAVGLTRTDLPRAAGMFEVACEEGEAAGCGNYAVMLRDGRGVAADRERATDLLDRACRLGHAPSCENRRALDR